MAILPPNIRQIQCFAPKFVISPPKQFSISVCLSAVALRTCLWPSRRQNFPHLDRHAHACGSLLDVPNNLIAILVVSLGYKITIMILLQLLHYSFCSAKVVVFRHAPMWQLASYGRTDNFIMDLPASTWSCEVLIGESAVAGTEEDGKRKIFRPTDVVVLLQNVTPTHLLFNFENNEVFGG